jgi:hypothetical protein
MSKDLHKIDDIFKNGLDGKEEMPSQKVWDHIEQALDEKTSRRPFVFFSRKVAAALLIGIGSAALFAGGYYLRGVHDSKDNDRAPGIEKTMPGSGESKDRSGQQTPPTTGQVGNHITPDKLPAVANHNLPHSGTLPTPDKAAVAPAKASSTTTAATAPKDAAINNRLSEASGNTDDAKSGGIAKNSISVDPPANPRISRSKDQRSETNLGEDKTDKRAKEPDTDAKTSSIDPAQADGSLTQPRVFQTAPLTTNQLNREISAEKQLLSSTQAFSQNELAPATATIPVLNKKQGSLNLPRFSLTPVVALQFGSNRIRENTSYANSSKVKAEIDRTESQPASIAGGILADLKISRNMTLQSGLVYTSRSIHIDPKDVIAERNPDGKVRYRFDCSAGTYFIKKAQGYTRPGDTAMTKFSTNDLNYLNIPLGLTYHFGGSSWHFFINAGAGLNLLTRQYLETGLKIGYYEEDDTKVTNLKNSYFNGNLGAGVIWSPFRKVSFSFNPQYQFALTPMNDNMPVKALPRIFNMQAGMQIRL